MPEAILERTKCDNCGTAVREGSQFCFHCGRSLGVIIESKGPVAIAKQGPRERDGIAPTIEGPSGPSPIAKPSVPLNTGEKWKAAETQPFQRKRKAVVRAVKPAEFEWVEPSSTIWRPFIAAAVIAIVVGLMLFAAWMLK